MERHHLKYSAERLWVYRDGVYHPDGEITVKQEAHALLGERRHEGHIQETLRYLEVETYTPPPEMDPDVINLQNGRFFWRTKTLAPTHRTSLISCNSPLPMILRPRARHLTTTARPHSAP